MGPAASALASTARKIVVFFQGGYAGVYGSSTNLAGIFDGSVAVELMCSFLGNAGRY
jgi:hypothetical protein